MLSFTCLPFSDLTTEVLYEVMVLRQEVFVVEQNCPYLDADGLDQISWHLMGRDQEGHLVAYARMMEKGVVYDQYCALGRVISAPSVRGKGAGRHLMREALDWMQIHFSGESIKISAQCYLIRFYESFGFQTIGEEYLEDDIPHIAMIRS